MHRSSFSMRRALGSTSLCLSIFCAGAGAAAERVDPGADPRVSSLLNQQAAAARWLAATQTHNVQDRLQALHGNDAACNRPERPARPASEPSVDGRPVSDGGPAVQAMPNPAPSLVLAGCRRHDAGTTWTAGAVEVGAKTEGQGFGFHSKGVTLGADRTLGQGVKLGLGLGLARDQDGASTDSNSAIDALAATAYLSYRPSSALFIDALAGYGDLQMRSVRHLDDRMSVAGERRGSGQYASVAAGYRLGWRGGGFAPYARFDALRTTLRAYTESDGTADALRFQRQSTPALKLALGFEGSSRIETRLGQLSPRGRFEMRHERERSAGAAVSYADAAQTSLATDGSETARSSLTAELGATLAQRDSWSIGAGYALDYASNVRTNRFDLKASWKLR